MELVCSQQADWPREGEASRQLELWALQTEPEVEWS